MRSAKTETGIAIIATAAILAVIACKTKTVTLTEYVNIHDTLVSVRTDTVRDVKVQTIRDTVTQKETHTYTLNNVGDTIREIHHYHDREKVIVVDSTDRYKAVVDSLRLALYNMKNSNKEVVKTKYLIRWWEYVLLLAIVGVVIFFVLKGGGKKYVDKI